MYEILKHVIAFILGSDPDSGEPNSAGPGNNGSH